MSFKDKSQPILILNIRLNDAEVKKCEIYSLNDATVQIQSFCTAHGIKNKEIVEGMRNRVAACVLHKDTYVDHIHKENTQLLVREACSTGKKDDKRNKRTKSRLLAIETSPQSIKMQCMIHTTKASQTTSKCNGSVQGKGYQLVKSLADSVKMRLFTSKATKNNDTVHNRQDKYADIKQIEQVPKSQSKAEQLLIHDIDNIMDEAEPDDLLHTSSESNVRVELYAGNEPLVHKPAKEPFTCSEYKPSRTPARRSFIKNADTERNNENSRGSHLNRNRIVKKSSFYEYSQGGDSKLERNIYDNFNDSCKLRKLQTASTASFEQDVLKKITLEELRGVFAKLDAESCGHIGPRKMDLRALSALQMKEFEPIVADILQRDSDACFNFKDFCKVTSNFMLID